MMRWFVALLIVAGLVVAFLVVPIGGRTLWQRFQGPAMESTGDKRLTAKVDPSREDKPATPGAGRNKDGKPGATPALQARDADQGPDLHSDEERKALDDLIERKLKAEP